MCAATSPTYELNLIINTRVGVDPIFADERLIFQKSDQTEKGV